MSKISCSLRRYGVFIIFFHVSIGHEKIGDDKQKYDFTSDN